MQCGEAKDLAKLSVSLCPSLGCIHPQCCAHAAELHRCGVAVSLGTRQPEPHQLLVGLGILENFGSFPNEPQALLKILLEV